MAATKLVQSLRLYPQELKIAPQRPSLSPRKLNSLLKNQCRISATTGNGVNNLVTEGNPSSGDIRNPFPIHSTRFKSECLMNSWICSKDQMITLLTLNSSHLSKPIIQPSRKKITITICSRISSKHQRIKIHLRTIVIEIRIYSCQQITSKTLMSKRKLLG